MTAYAAFQWKLDWMIFSKMEGRSELKKLEKNVKSRDNNKKAERWSSMT